MTAAQIQRMQAGTGNICMHGFDSFSISSQFQFMSAFVGSFDEARGSLPECLIAARKATMDEFADVWHDHAKMKFVISYFLCS